MPVAADGTRSSLPGRAAAVILLAVLAAVATVMLLSDRPLEVGTSPTPAIEVGEPGGTVVGSLVPSPTPSATPSPTMSAEPTSTPVAVAVPSASPSQPPPTATPAAVRSPASTPAPTPAPPASTERPTAPPTPSPAPTAATAVLGDPDAAVAAFYRHVVAGEFDAAYALWSDRMKATYPRQENLDDRFAETVEIVWEQLYVAEHRGSSATVQANFVERYASGGSRRFIGYWELVLVDGRWLLDAPTY